MEASAPVALATERGLRVLSLDGGGVRGLSALYILRHLMRRLDYKNPPRPCEYFDLIAGTSTGGLIAIMLGRLCMSTDECIEAYQQLSERVFKPKRLKLNYLGRGKDLVTLAGAFDEEELAQAVQDVVVQSGRSATAKLLDADSQCKIFVCARRAEVNRPVRLRSYETPTTVQEVDCTIVEAARATSAASTFFRPVVIQHQMFVDGATGCNNPVEEALDEVLQIWSGDRRIERFLSIGTGIPAMSGFGNNLQQLAKSLIKISTDTEETAERFEKMAVRANGLSGLYFRFNARGLEGVGLEDHASLGLIAAATNSYLNEYQTLQKLNSFAAQIPSFLNYAQQQAYLQSLRTYNVLGELRGIASPAGSTFHWVLDADEFRAWSTGTERPILLIKGKPGCGKSVLMAFLHRSTTKGSVAFFACKQTDNIRRSPETILSSLLRQILSDQPNLFRYVVPKTLGAESWTYQELLESFEGVLTSSDNTGVTCMIDALDECHEATLRRFVKDLSRLSDLVGRRNSAGYSRIIISARNWAAISFPSAVELDLDSAPQMVEDLNKFVFLKVDELVIARPHYASEINLICDSLLERASGMYRLVELVVSDLEYMTDSSPLSIQRTLRSVPGDISMMYDRIWSRISPADSDRAKNIFMWILCCLGPLSLDALEVAIAMSSMRASAEFKDIQSNIPADVARDLLGLFGPLVKITDAVVDVSHPSVRDHFLKADVHLYRYIAGIDNLIQLDEAHSSIAISCLRYLNAFATSLSSPRRIPNDFLDYSLKYFAKHVAHASAQNDELDAEIIMFFENGHWLGLWEQTAPHDLILAPSVFVPTIDDVLEFACYYGRTSIIRGLLSSGDLPLRFTCPSGFCSYMLIRSIYLSIVGFQEQSLAEAILLMDRVLLRDWKPLQFLSLISGQISEEESSAHAPQPPGWPPLPSDELSTMAPLDWKNDDPSHIDDAIESMGNPEPGSPRTKYFCVTRRIHDMQMKQQSFNRSKEDIGILQRRVVRVFRTLIPRDSSGEHMGTVLQDTDWVYNTALVIGFYMVWTYGVESTDLLARNSSALLEAASSNRTQAVRAMLEQGVEVHGTRDDDGASVLHLAAAVGNAEIVKEILARKTGDVNSVDNQGRTPLHFACSQYTIWDSDAVLKEQPPSISRARVVSLLLQAGSDRVARDHKNNTPFQTLSRVFVPEWDDIPKHSVLNWRESDLNETIELLLQDLGDVIEWDSYGVTPLHYAAYLWPLSAVKQLLAFLGTFFVTGSLVDHLGHTPLHYAAFRGFDSPERVIDLLCQAGVDPRVQQINGETALAVARGYGRQAAERALAEHEKRFDEEARKTMAPTLRTPGALGERDLSHTLRRMAQTNRVIGGVVSPVMFDLTMSKLFQHQAMPLYVRTSAPSTELQLAGVRQHPPRMSADPWAKCIDYPSMQLRNQIQRAQQFLSAGRGGQPVAEAGIPRDLLVMLSFRIYDLRTVEPFGRIDQSPLARPVPQDRLKMISPVIGSGNLLDYVTLVENDVNYHAPRRRDTSRLTREGSLPFDDGVDLAEWEQREHEKRRLEKQHDHGAAGPCQRSSSLRPSFVMTFETRLHLELWILLNLLIMIGRLLLALFPDVLPLGHTHDPIAGLCRLQHPVRGNGWYLGHQFDHRFCGTDLGDVHFSEDSYTE